MIKSEAKIVADIVKVLAKLKKRGEPVWWVKIAGGPWQRAGLPDLCVVYRGQTLFVEVKKSPNVLTLLQIETIRAIRHAGVAAEVVWSVAEFRRVLGV